MNAAETCAWSEDEQGAYDTEYSHVFECLSEGPAENSFAYCPYCGGRIVLEQAPTVGGT